MILWRKKLPYPQVEVEGERYYEVKPSDIGKLDGVKVKFKGAVLSKPRIMTFTAGWPWSISSRLIEYDHGHMTVLNVSGVEVRFKGIAVLRVNDEVTVYGVVKSGFVEARIIESSDAIFKSS